NEHPSAARLPAGARLTEGRRVPENRPGARLVTPSTPPVLGADALVAAALPSTRAHAPAVAAFGLEAVLGGADRAQAARPRRRSGDGLNHGDRPDGTPSDCSPLQKCPSVPRLLLHPLHLRRLIRSLSDGGLAKSTVAHQSKRVQLRNQLYEVGLHLSQVLPVSPSDVAGQLTNAGPTIADLPNEDRGWIEVMHEVGLV